MSMCVKFLHLEREIKLTGASGLHVIDLRTPEGLPELVVHGQVGTYTKWEHIMSMMKLLVTSY